MRHHYVPQFLLSPWAEGSADGKVEVFRLDLPSIKSSRHTTKYTGFDDDLYALTKDVVAGMEKQAVEKRFLMNVDNRAAVARDKLDSQGLKSLTNEEKVDWARFLMSLRIRQPETVQLLRNDATEHLRESLNENPNEYDELKPEGEEETLEEWTERQYPGLTENFGLSFFHELIDNPYYGNRILRMRWWVWDFTGVPYELLLSDHPCVFTHGIDNAKCIIALPISPTKAFLATQDDNVADILRRSKPRELVVRLNESALVQTRVRIYARYQSPAMRFIENRRRMRR